MAGGRQWYEPRQHPDFRVLAQQKHLGKRKCPAMNNQSNVALRKKTISRELLCLRTAASRQKRPFKQLISFLLFAYQSA